MEVTLITVGNVATGPVSRWVIMVAAAVTIFFGVRTAITRTDWRAGSRLATPLAGCPL